jgi:hypothetical protein
LDEEKLRSNEKKIFAQVVNFLKHLKSNYNIDFEYDMVNNYDFYK